MSDETGRPPDPRTDVILTRPATRLALIALLAGLGIAPSAADDPPVVLTPVIAVEGGRVQVGPGAALDVSGVSPDGALVSARVLGYEADGGIVVQPFSVGSLSAGPRPSGEHLQLLRGALDGRVVLGCLFDAKPSADPTTPRQCAPHDPILSLAVEVTVRVDGALQSALSTPLVVDAVRPRVQRAEVVRRDELRVVFDEVVEADGPERTGEWNVLHGGARYSVAVVSLGDPGDCPGDERRCARRLELATPLPEDATPTVQWTPSAPDSAYVDLAGNAYRAGLLHVAADAVRPGRPRITAVDGVPVTGPRPRVASGRRSPVLTVLGVPAGYGVLVRATPERGPVAESAPVVGTDPGIPVSVAAPVLPPGGAGLDAVVVDPAGNRSTSTLEPGRADLAPAAVDHVLDQVAPQPTVAVLSDARTAVVTFSEPVSGTDDATDWYLLDGGVRTAVTAVAGGGATRVLTAATDVAVTAVLHHAPLTELRVQRDDAGNALGPSAVPVNGLAVPAVSSLQVAEVVRATSYTLSGGARAGTVIDAFLDADGNRVPDGPPVTSGPATPAFALVLPLVRDAANEFLLQTRDPDSGSVSPLLDLPPVVQDSLAPELTFAAPAAGTAVAGGSVRPLGVAYGEANPAAVEVALSLDGGLSYATLPPAATAGASSWAVPATATDRAVLRLTAVDAADRRTVVRSGTFVIDAAPPALQPATLDASTVVVRLSELSVQGSSTASDWEVDNERVTAVAERVEAGILVARLTVRSALTRDEQPLVTYLGNGPSAYRDRSGQSVVQRDVRAADGVLPTAPTVVAPVTTQLTTADQQRLTGRAGSGDLVEIVDAAERPAARVRAGSDGTWSTEVPLARDVVHAFRAQTRDGSGGRSATAVTVAKIEQDATDPAVTVTEPGAGSRLEAGQRVTVRWTSVDRNVQEGKSLVQASTDGGRTWSALGAQQRATGSLVWTIPKTSTSEALVRVFTSDLAGRTGTGVSGMLGIGAPASTASPSASASASRTPSPSASPTGSPDPSASPSSRATRPPASAPPANAPPPAPAPVPEPPAAPDEPAPAALRIAVDVRSTTPGVGAVVRVTGTPGTAVELHAYSRPKTEYAVVRTGVLGKDGRVSWPVRPGTNTRMFAHVVDGDEATDSPSAVLEVRTAMSLTVVRKGARDYVFQGRVLPRRAGLLVTLYRVQAAKRAIVRQVRTDPAGVYRVPRRFTGVGRFGFLARTGANMTNAAGESDEGVVRQVQIR